MSKESHMVCNRVQTFAYTKTHTHKQRDFFVATCNLPLIHRFTRRSWFSLQMVLQLQQQQVANGNVTSSDRGWTFIS